MKNIKHENKFFIKYNAIMDKYISRFEYNENKFIINIFIEYNKIIIIKNNVIIVECGFFDTHEYYDTKNFSITKLDKTFLKDGWYEYNKLSNGEKEEGSRPIVLPTKNMIELVMNAIKTKIIHAIDSNNYKKLQIKLAKLRG